jgi:hypothetical protein
MTDTGTMRAAVLFTPESANRALPYVRAVVEDLVDAAGRLQAAEEARGRALAGLGPQGGKARLPEAAREKLLRDLDDARRTAREDLARVLGELERVGVEVKDPAQGLLDFPGEIDGRRVCLCWRRGEERVAFWHDIEAGFKGRRPLPA